jgi:hypothetical protein
MMVAQMTNYLAGGPAWESHQEVIRKTSEHHHSHYQMTCDLAGGSPDDELSGRWSGRDKSSEHHHSPLPDDLLSGWCPVGPAWISHQEVIRISSFTTTR